MLNDSERTYNFTVIIPHRNIPALLQRALDSVPVREDLQVVVVDDASSPDKVDFSRFPGMDRPDTEVVLTKEGGGAGYARNVGLQHARGKWVLFLDADDFFSEACNRVLDEVKDRPEDMIFFGYRSVMSDDITKPGIRAQYMNYIVTDWLAGDHSEHAPRYLHDLVHGKFIRRSMLEQFGLRCHETVWSNDVFLAAACGCHARTIDVIADDMYVITTRPQSLAYSFCRKKGEFTVRMQEHLFAERYIARCTGVRNAKKCSINGVLRAAWRNNGVKWFTLQCLKETVHPRLFLLMVRFEAKTLWERALRALKHGD